MVIFWAASSARKKSATATLNFDRPVRYCPPHKWRPVDAQGFLEEPYDTDRLRLSLLACTICSKTPQGVLDAWRGTE